jgi:hypothetical protein
VIERYAAGHRAGKHRQRHRGTALWCLATRMSSRAAGRRPAASFRRPPQRCHAEPDFSAMLRWPNVPACYGWLSLDRAAAGACAAKRSPIAGLNDFLNRQYAHDEDGNYFVQNGPQRVFRRTRLHAVGPAPGGAGPPRNACRRSGHELRGAAIDEEGNLLLEIPDGIALLCDRDLPALLPLPAPGERRSRRRRERARGHRAAGAGRSALTLAWQGSACRCARCADRKSRTLWLSSPHRSRRAAGSPLNLRQLALDALLLSGPDEKCTAVQASRRSSPLERSADRRPPDRSRLLAETLPGRSARPLLVPPAQLAQRPVSTVEGRAALIHSLAHIELNAVNLALDIVWRFDACRRLLP